MGNSARPFLPYGRQCIDESDIAAVVGVLKSDWLTTGPAVDAFEKAFSRYVGAAHALSCSSGTAALHLAALALGLGPGDTVIVPSITFLATANAPRLTGAEIVFSDVDPETGLMRASDLEAALQSERGRQAKAVFVVHMAGQCDDLPAIQALARRNRLHVVEDASHALGTVYAHDGREYRVGQCAHSDIAVFSLHPVKTIAGGEGGAATTNDANLAARIALMRNHGMQRNAESLTDTEMAFDSSGEKNPWYYEMTEVGLNYRLSDIHCALAQSQLTKIDGFVERRRQLVATYDQRLTHLRQALVPLHRNPDCLAAWHLYVARIDFISVGQTRAAIMQQLSQAGIGSQVHYIPVHRQPYYRQRYGMDELNGADEFYARTLSLPLFPTMSDSDLEYVCDTLTGILAIGDNSGRHSA